MRRGGPFVVSLRLTMPLFAIAFAGPWDMRRLGLWLCRGENGWDGQGEYGVQSDEGRVTERERSGVGVAAARGISRPKLPR